MTTAGVDFLEKWIGKRVRVETTKADAGWLAAHLLAEATVAGFTLADMELEDANVEDYVREAIVHLREPETPGD